MKKFFYVALMALTVGLMAGCSAKSGSSDYYKDGKEPQIDFNEGTVNGVKYDTKTETCWKFTVKTTTLGITASATEYTWGTEWSVYAACEETMYFVAQAGVSKASYSVIEAPLYDDSESCLDNNDNK